MMRMRYLSLCSGIEAATVAWHPLGWRAVAFSEIEPFPSAVLAHHYPNTPNRGDMTKFMEWPDAAIDLLVGGTPCQSFSVAGLRKGLDDPRGNLMLTFGAIAARYRPRWLVWENVPGVLSSNGGRDFGTFLGMLAELGYGFAYRILDAQYYGVAQRRRRVFVVGYLGDWRRAAAALFERHSLSWHPAPSRQAGQNAAPTLVARTRGGGGLGTDRDGGLIASTGDISHCLNAGGMGRIDFETETLIAHTLRSDGFDASDDGTGRGTPLVPVAFPATLSGTQCASAENLCPSLCAENPTAVAYGFQPRIARNGRGDMGDVVSTLNAQSGETGKGDSAPCVATENHVRRLTPRECERLQGFPDDYTRIPWRIVYWDPAKYPAEVIGALTETCPDSPRYKALGNSMAVPVMRWIGERIEQVEWGRAERMAE